MTSPFEGMEINLPNGHKVKAEDYLDGKVVALYFSTGWSTPCVKFTKALKLFYEKLTAAGKNFEVVFISCDQTEEGLTKFRAEHHGNWAYLPFGSPQIIELLEKYAVKTVPMLKIIKDDGRTIVDDGYAQVSIFGSDEEWLFDKWMRRCSSEDLLRSANFNWEIVNESLVLWNGDGPVSKKRKSGGVCAKPPDPKLKHVCPNAWCPWSFCSSSKLGIHVIVCEEPKEQRKKNVLCEVVEAGEQCEEAYTRHKGLIAHLNGTTGHFKLQLSCLLCDPNKSAFSLNTDHFKNSHTEKIECIHCQESFTPSKYRIHTLSFAYEIQCIKEERLFSRAFDEYLQIGSPTEDSKQLFGQVTTTFKDAETRNAKHYVFVDPRDLPNQVEQTSREQFAEALFYGGSSDDVVEKNRLLKHNSEVVDQDNRKDDASRKISKMQEIYAADQDIIVVELDNLSKQECRIFESGTLQALNSTGRLTNKRRGELAGEFTIWNADRDKLALFGCEVFERLYKKYISNGFRRLSKRQAKDEVTDFKEGRHMNSHSELACQSSMGETSNLDADTTNSSTGTFVPSKKRKFTENGVESTRLPIPTYVKSNEHQNVKKKLLAVLWSKGDPNFVVKNHDGGVYVELLNTRSLAGLQVEHGDRILQVGGKQITDREEAILAFEESLKMSDFVLMAVERSESNVVDTSNSVKVQFSTETCVEAESNQASSSSKNDQ